MTQVEFMDSSGLATLVGALKWCRRNGSQLKLVGLVQRVRNIFEISRLESIFQIYDSEAEALT
jgi:anti-sigma B factor antagonist